uniref:Uncharacterized protein n=1 Tax=Solanum lycopersicum TaxID=4081 RepID=A0A3Q7G2A7_SOLLC
MELEKQGNMDVHSVAQQMAPHQFDINNWINPFSSTIQNQDWMDKGKRVANSLAITHIPLPSLCQQKNMMVDVHANSLQIFGQSQSQRQNIMVDVHRNPTQTFGQPQSQQQNMEVDILQNPTQVLGQAHSQQQNMVVGVQKNPTFGQSQIHQQDMEVDVQQNSTQTFGQLHNQQPNMLVGLQQKSTETFGLSEEQLTFGESSDNSLTKFWQNNCASTRYDSSPLVNMGTQLNSPSQLGLEYDHSNWNINLDNNNNINRIIQSNGQFSIQSDAIASNVNELNFPMEENTMANNEYFAETIHENDAWEWDDVLLNEAFGGDDF